MEVTIWGTRGSLPTMLSSTARYGGNTTCIEVHTDAGETIIFDAGTGIRALGKHLCARQEGGECAICFTHRHWDHVHGLISFAPLYDPEWDISMYGPHCTSSSWQHTMEIIFDGCHFPVTWGQIGQSNHIEEFSIGESFTIGSALIETCAVCHPGGGVAYKITADGWTFFFSGDHEWDDGRPSECTKLVQFMNGSNVVLADAHFPSEEYNEHRGWGHSTMQQWIDRILETDVRRMVFTHYHPDCTDESLEKRMDEIWRESPNLPLQLVLAREGMCISKDAGHNPFGEALLLTPCSMCDFSRRVSRYADSGIILESVLSEARHCGQADAGSIYLISEGDKLAFAYAQNETLFPGSAANKMTYLNAVVPMGKSSIAGYVACTATPLNIANVRTLPNGVPYSFNDAFDIASSYRTVSMLTVPLIGSHNEVVGVIQLINSLQDGKPQPFTLSMQNKLERLAITAADSIERSRLSNALIVRMLETAALRDPTETAGHVMRVGAMSAEIYHRWAEKHDISAEELRASKDIIRLAAMLHDVGKVGVPDAILKKPGKLTIEEFTVIQTHCSMGAGLFKNPTTRLDIMAYDIALHHHQKWNGKGYTGDPTQPCLSATDIPLEARITAVADVYDALVSARCYKAPMSEDEAIAILQKDAGSHFDPEIVNVFMEIREVISAIHHRFSD